MRKMLVFLAMVSFLSSCKEETEEREENTGAEALSEQIAIESNRSVSLTPEAMESVSQWLAFATAQNEIRDMRSFTGHQIITSSNPLAQIMETLQTTIPDTLKVVPVETRINVLVTKAKVLDQLSSKRQKDADEIFRAANELILEFDNFKLQLNERFLRSPEAFESELDRQFQEARDSVERARNEGIDSLPIGPTELEVQE